MVTPLFKKLNFEDHAEILVVNAPASFESELAALEDVVVQRSPAAIQSIPFALAFVTQQAEVDDLAQAIPGRIAPRITPQAPGDSVLWFAYPKGSSKTYTCEFNRDTGWAVLGELGFEPVRQVAIDADWSALGFRRVEFIKSMTRDTKRAISSAGKARSLQQSEP